MCLYSVTMLAGANHDNVVLAGGPCEGIWYLLWQLATLNQSEMPTCLPMTPTRQQSLSAFQKYDLKRIHN